MSHIITRLLYLLEIDKNRGGKDLKTWVKEVIIPRLEFDQNGNPIMPNPEPDIDRFSHLHSWYKHFRGKAVRVYPILRIGQEPRGNIGSDRLTTKDQNKLFWSFVTESNIDIPYDTYYAKKNLPWGIMYDHYVHLSAAFSNYSSDLYEFHKMALIRESTLVWDKILKLICDYSLLEVFQSTSD
jgi:hypothetical protein